MVKQVKQAEWKWLKRHRWNQRTWSSQYSLLSSDDCGFVEEGALWHLQLQFHDDKQTAVGNGMYLLAYSGWPRKVSPVFSWCVMLDNRSIVVKSRWMSFLWFWNKAGCLSQHWNLLLPEVEGDDEESHIVGLQNSWTDTIWTCSFEFLHLRLHLTVRYTQLEGGGGPSISWLFETTMSQSQEDPWLRWKTRQLRCNREGVNQGRLGGLFGWGQDRRMLSFFLNWTCRRMFSDRWLCPNFHPWPHISCCSAGACSPAFSCTVL